MSYVPPHMRGAAGGQPPPSGAESGPPSSRMGSGRNDDSRSGSGRYSTGRGGSYDRQGAYDDRRGGYSSGGGGYDRGGAAARTPVSALLAAGLDGRPNPSTYSLHAANDNMIFSMISYFTCSVINI